jgi:hypothetical protein
LWRIEVSQLFKAYLFATIILLIVLFPIMTGATGLDMNGLRGLLQRVLALTVFVPIGVGAYVLVMRIRTGAARCPSVP